MNNPHLTCDWCRAKKIRCVEVETPREWIEHSGTSHSDAPTCRACSKRHTVCSFDYSHKRPGRPAGNRRESRLSRVGSSPASSSINHAVEPADSTILPASYPTPNSLILPAGDDRLPDPAEGSTHNSFSPSVEAGPSRAGPAAWSLWGSAKSVYVPDLFEGAFPITGSSESESPVHYLTPFDTSLDVDAALELLFPAEQSLGTSELVSPARGNTSVETSVTPSMESIAPWGAVCFFISLHIKYQYALVPLVHKPSFAQDLLHRRDLNDETFKGFLCSIITHTICQTPIRMMQQSHTLEHLEGIVVKCREVSRQIQAKYQNRLNYNVAASVVLDMITSQSTCTSKSADLLAGEARRVIYALRYHVAELQPGMTFIEEQLARRLFWEAYCVDKTIALNGSPIMFHDLEGTPPYPIIIDDEYITRTGSTATATTASNAAVQGCLVILELFRLLYSVTVRHRAHRNCPEKLVYTSQDGQLKWTEASISRIDEILQGLPVELKIPIRNPNTVPSGGDHLEIGIQQANIHVTALVTKLALITFKGELTPEGVATEEVESAARDSFTLLSSIPIEYLAANGESMVSLRGKVLRVIVSLQTSASNPADLGGAAWDWWNMYSRVRFLQVIPAD